MYSAASVLVNIMFRALEIESAVKIKTAKLGDESDEKHRERVGLGGDI